MQRYFQVTPPSVHQMILTLESKGLIERFPGEGRSSARWLNLRTCRLSIDCREPIRRIYTYVVRRVFPVRKCAGSQSMLRRSR